MCWSNSRSLRVIQKMNEGGGLMLITIESESTHGITHRWSPRDAEELWQRGSFAMLSSLLGCDLLLQSRSQFQNARDAIASRVRFVRKLRNHVPNLFAARDEFWLCAAFHL